VTVGALLNGLRAQGIDIGLDRGRVRVEGPDEVLTETVLDELKARKAEILLHLCAPLRPRLVIVRHQHHCRCGQQFQCTAPSCVGKNILCACCKLDRTSGGITQGGDRAGE